MIGAALFLAAYTVAAYSDRLVTALGVGYAVVVIVGRRRGGSDGHGDRGSGHQCSAVHRGLRAGAQRPRPPREVVLLQERAQLAEQARADEARHAVADERLRIAQELQDVLGHSLGVIALQAGVGAHVIDVDPAEAKASLEAISRTSRSSLAEVRRILGALRADDGRARVPSATRARRPRSPGLRS